MSTSASVGSGLQSLQLGPTRVGGEGSLAAGLSFFLPAGYETTDGTRPSSPTVVTSNATRDRRAVLDLSYALTDDWSFQAAFPARSIQVDSPRVDYARPMDPEVRLNRVLSTDPLFTKATVSVFLPLADDDLTAGGARLSDGLQPGRGSYGMRLEGYCSGEVAPDLALFASCGTRWELEENGYGYRFGRVVDTSLGAAASFNTFSLFVAGSLVHASGDESSGITVPDTGGTLVYVTPGIRLEFLPKATLLVADQIEVHRDVEGRQALPKHTVVTGLTFLF